MDCMASSWSSSAQYAVSHFCTSGYCRAYFSVIGGIGLLSTDAGMRRIFGAFLQCLRVEFRFERGVRVLLTLVRFEVGGSYFWYCLVTVCCTQT